MIMDLESTGLLISAVCVILSILGIIGAVIVYIISVVGLMFYVKFQTNQNKKDIEKFEVKLDMFILKSDDSLSKIYNKIEDVSQRTSEGFNDIKEQFVAVGTCKELRSTIKHGD